MAASSGDPGGSKEAWPCIGNPSNVEFSSLTYLLLRSKDDKVPLTSNPFIVGQSVELAAGGPIEGASTEAQCTRYTLKVRNQTQVKKLLRMSTLLDGVEVIIEPHPILNVSRCVISCFETVHMTEDAMLDGLNSQGVIRVQRITRKEHGKPVNTSALILTFGRCDYPSHVKIGLLRVATRPYYPNPLLCYGCVRFGHPRVRCPGPKRCVNCSAEHELLEGEVCSFAAHCINCNGPHRPTSRQCPVFKKEMEVVRLKVDQNLSFPEARRRIEQDLGSYAAAAAQQTADRKRLDELEKKMEQKEALISQLLVKIQDKDERIEQLLLQINRMKTVENQDSQQNTPTQPLKSCQANKPSEPVKPIEAIQKAREQLTTATRMQLRNRSPATTQTAGTETRNRKKKHNRSTNGSPGRQSPPPKKTPAEEDPNQEELSDNGIEIEETPPSQSFR